LRGAARPEFIAAITHFGGPVAAIDWSLDKCVHLRYRRKVPRGASGRKTGAIDLGVALSVLNGRVERCPAQTGGALAIGVSASQGALTLQSGVAAGFVGSTGVRRSPGTGREGFVAGSTASGTLLFNGPYLNLSATGITRTLVFIPRVTRVRIRPITGIVRFIACGNRAGAGYSRARIAPAQALAAAVTVFVTIAVTAIIRAFDGTCFRGPAVTVTARVAILALVGRIRGTTLKAGVADFAVRRTQNVLANTAIAGIRGAAQIIVAVFSCAAASAVAVASIKVCTGITIITGCAVSRKFLGALTICRVA
jgi:hypothetical protein